MFKEGFKLYYNRSGLAPETCDRENLSSADNRITEELASKILELKNQMNKKRVNFQQPSDHRINITPNWLLGLIEGEGFFSVATKTTTLVFGLGLTEVELDVLKAIQKFLLNLPGEYRITRSDSNPVSLMVDSKAKDANSKPMAKLASLKADYLTNVLVPFLDNLTWLSKKLLDYNDWKLILKIKNQGKHFTEDLRPPGRAGGWLCLGERTYIFNC